MLGGMGASGTALAHLVVTTRADVLPIHVDVAQPHSATYPGTGYKLGAAAALEIEWTISGTEYDGSPSPLTWIKVYTPAGTRMHPQGFPTCPEALLAADGPEACPRGSLAGAPGEGVGVVTFGDTRVPETVAVEPFFRPGGLFWYVRGQTPAAFELISKGTVVPNPQPGFAELATGEVPLVESVPGGLFASIERLKLTVGAAFMRDGKLISYGTLPNSCPKGGFTGKTELSFLNGETISTAMTLACPKPKAGSR
ncbi:MAG TPA: hypothetical protein VMD79_12660 [Solirubrobacteraceae bacterium]|nr:hypothetical protein [Solirubrobacteraceae bacterium]